MSGEVGRPLAITHAVGEALLRCELTFVARAPIDLARARAQHAEYRRVLTSLGAEVRVVDVSPQGPDAVFVEDAVVVLADRAVLTRMGVASRRAEVENLAPVLGEYRRLVRVEAPATLEGGDVLRVGRTLYVGQSVRTDAAGIAALAAHAEPAGYRVVRVAVEGCLHLKTACTALDAETLLANPGWVDVGAFQGMKIVEVDASEPFGANTLPIGGTICVSAAHPRTAARIAALGFPVVAIDISELEKAEAGLTCLSVLIEG